MVSGIAFLGDHALERRRQHFLEGLTRRAIRANPADGGCMHRALKKGDRAHHIRRHLAVDLTGPETSVARNLGVRQRGLDADHVLAAVVTAASDGGTI